MRPKVLRAPACVAIAIVVGVVLVPGASSAPSRLSCRSGVTLDENATARMFIRRGGGSIYGCMKDTGRLRSLGSEGDSGRYDNGQDEHVLAGRYVAFREYSCDPDSGCEGYVVVKDLRSGRIKVRGSASDGNASVLLPSADGDVVLAGSSNLVYRSAKRRMILDRSAGVNPRSVLRSTSRVYWIRDGEPQTARVPGFGLD